MSATENAQDVAPLTGGGTTPDYPVDAPTVAHYTREPLDGLDRESFADQARSLREKVASYRTCIVCGGYVESVTTERTELPVLLHVSRMAAWTNPPHTAEV